MIPLLLMLDKGKFNQVMVFQLNNTFTQSSLTTKVNGSIRISHFTNVHGSLCLYNESFLLSVKEPSVLPLLS